MSKKKYDPFITFWLRVQNNRLWGELQAKHLYQHFLAWRVIVQSHFKWSFIYGYKSLLVQKIWGFNINLIRRFNGQINSVKLWFLWLESESVGDKHPLVAHNLYSLLPACLNGEADSLLVINSFRWEEQSLVNIIKASDAQCWPHLNVSGHISRDVPEKWNYIKNEEQFPLCAFCALCRYITVWAPILSVTRHPSLLINAECFFSLCITFTYSVIHSVTSGEGGFEWLAINHDF